MERLQPIRGRGVEQEHTSGARIVSLSRSLLTSAPEAGTAILMSAHCFFGALDKAVWYFLEETPPPPPFYNAHDEIVLATIFVLRALVDMKNLEAGDFKPRCAILEERITPGMEQPDFTEGIYCCALPKLSCGCRSGAFSGVNTYPYGAVRVPCKMYPQVVLLYRVLFSPSWFNAPTQTLLLQRGCHDFPFIYGISSPVHCMSIVPAFDTPFLCNDVACRNLAAGSYPVLAIATGAEHRHVVHAATAYPPHCNIT